MKIMKMLKKVTKKMKSKEEISQKIIDDFSRTANKLMDINREIENEMEDAQNTINEKTRVKNNLEQVKLKNERISEKIMSIVQ